MNAATKHKICLLGDVGVGKTSLVTRFVHGGYSADYLTTVGVKIDTKVVEPPRGSTVKFVIWDIAGTEALSSIDRTYTRGASGFFLVADGTRPASLEVAAGLHDQLDDELKALPFVPIINKRDLAAELTDESMARWRQAGFGAITTSARTGENVEFAFAQLAMQIALS
ncbi:MAG: Rab family GTPase [Pseudomonadota bacterium]